MRDVHDALLAQGWRLERRGNDHTAAWPPGGAKPSYMGSDPSGPAAVKKIVSDLKRLGFVYDR